MNARVNLQTQPDAPVPLQAQRSCVRYEAQTELGTWRLRLALDDAHGASHSAAVAAQALLRAEDLLLALDTWCVHAGLSTLAWTWPAIAERQSDVGDHGRAARARWLGDATGITFGAPWAALRRLGAPPPDLQAALRWDEAWAACVLDRLTLDAESEAGLEPGGAVLIAPSLGAPWRGALRGAGEADDAGLVLDLAAAEGGVAIVATPVHSAERRIDRRRLGDPQPAPRARVRAGAVRMGATRGAVAAGAVHRIGTGALRRRVGPSPHHARAADAVGPGRCDAVGSVVHGSLDVLARVGPADGDPSGAGAVRCGDGDVVHQDRGCAEPASQRAGPATGAAERGAQRPGAGADGLRDVPGGPGDAGKDGHRRAFQRHAKHLQGSRCGEGAAARLPLQAQPRPRARLLPEDREARAEGRRSRQAQRARFPGGGAGLHRHRTRACLRDRLPDLPALSRHRPRDRQHPDGAGHDDVVAHHDFDCPSSCCCSCWSTAGSS